MATVIQYDCDLCGVRFKDERRSDAESARRRRGVHEMIRARVSVHVGEGKDERPADLCADCREFIANAAASVTELLDGRAPATD
jgi:hypothetical protein